MPIWGRPPAVAAALALLGAVTALLGTMLWWGGPRQGGDWAWTLAIAIVYGPSGAALATRAPRLGRVLVASSRLGPEPQCSW